MGRGNKQRKNRKNKDKKDNRRRKKSSDSSDDDSDSNDAEMKASAAAFGLTLRCNDRPYPCSSTSSVPGSVLSASRSISELCLRKPKQLALKQSMSKLSDLGPALLATSVARLMPMLTENSLMKLGGDLLEACHICWIAPLGLHVSALHALGLAG